MSYEIDFLPVGDGEQSGDAITVRFGDFTGPQQRQTVFVIDGGTKESGQQLIEHIQEYYATAHVDAVISTHPDADHASGLTVVLEQLSVDHLVMHRPWEHATEIKELFKRKFTDTGLEENLEKSLVMASEIEAIAIAKKVKIHEPFAGLTGFNGVLHVLGPTQEYYQSLLPHFRSTPQPKIELGIFQKIAKPVEEAIEWVAENLNIETLDDSAEHFSAENSSSAILLLSIGSDQLLLTGDADIPALTAAIDYAANNGINLSGLTLFHVPHHGSKHNVGPAILNLIRPRQAIVSAGPDAEPKHPSRKVTNALYRRGAAVYATQGKKIYFRSQDLPMRAGWSPAPTIPFYELVEK